MAFACLGILVAHLFGLQGLWIAFVMGFALGLAPRWPVRVLEVPVLTPGGPALRVDPTGMIAYLTVRAGRHDHTVAEIPSVNADFDLEGNLLGLEFEVWPIDDRPAVPQAWPPYDGYDKADDDNDEDENTEGEGWKR